MTLGPMLETARLILRPLEAQDFEPMCALMADEEAARFIGGVQTRHEVWRALAALIGAWELRGYSMFAVIEKSSGDWVGRLGPWYPEGWPSPEIGWTLKRAAWGKGYATEGAAATMDHAFNTLGWDEAIHCIDPANVASVRVAERLGSRFLRQQAGPAPISHVTWDLYGQGAADWRARKA